MSFLIFSDANIQFGEKEFEWKSYITAKVLPTTKKVELINKREFAIATLDKNTEFVIYIATLLVAPIILAHISHKTQVNLLLTDKAAIKIRPKNLNYTDIFLFDLATELPENTDINKHAIE